MIKHLLTITCTRDKKQMILQSYSIEKFVLTPCVHWVFIEDTNTSIDEWHEILNVYYKGIHTLKIIKLNVNETVSGWHRQEIGKLEAFQYINDDYIVFDTKNFFFRETYLNWKISEGNGLLSNTDFNNFDEFIDLCSKMLNLPIPKFFHSQDTPFKFQKNVMEKIQKINFSELIIESQRANIMSCEQVVYDFFSNTIYDESCMSEEYRKEHVMRFIWWFNDSFREDDFEKIYNSKSEVIGIHRNFWVIKNEKINLIGEWLIKEFDFDGKIIKDNLIDLEWDPKELSHQYGAPGEI